MTLVAE